MEDGSAEGHADTVGVGHAASVEDAIEGPQERHSGLWATLMSPQERNNIMSPQAEQEDCLANNAPMVLPLAVPVDV